MTHLKDLVYKKKNSPNQEPKRNSKTMPEVNWIETNKKHNIEWNYTMLVVLKK